jgi:tRNA pseudouridine55 synthase
MPPLPPLIDGTILPINKPLGLTSHDVVARIRRLSGIKRVGHAGTLDPLADGLLIILIGRSATKRQAEFMDMPKVYSTTVTFGSTSATDDAEGPLTVTATTAALQALDEARVTAALPTFIGTITQRPPMHSAIKQNGQPLYKKARAGTLTTADVPQRTVQVDQIDLLDFTPVTPTTPPTCRLRIWCHKGTYIRSIARDLGELLGTGSYMSQLTREQIGSYHRDKAYELPLNLQTR